MKSRFNHTSFGGNNNSNNQNQNNQPNRDEQQFNNQSNQEPPKTNYNQSGFGNFMNQAKNKINEMKNKPGDLSETDDEQAYQEYDNPQSKPNSNKPNQSQDGYDGEQYNDSKFQKKFSDKKVGVLEKLVVVVLIAGGGWFGYQHFMSGSHGNQNTQQSSSKGSNPASKVTQTVVNTANKNQYKYPSERGTKYPSPYAVSALNVSLKDQKIYVMSGKNVIYTMLMSSGKNGTTPTGDFSIQAQQGKKSWDDQYKTGMLYWQSYNGNGKYRFSTLPADQKGNIIPPDENYLGVKPTTINGNIVLSTPDAKFVYNLVLGTPVHIYNK